MSFFDSLPQLDLSHWGILGDTHTFVPDKETDVSTPRPHKFSTAHWSLRYDGPPAAFRRRLAAWNYAVQTFTEAPNFVETMRNVGAGRFNVITGGRDCALRYDREKMSLQGHDTTVLYPHAYGAGRQIRNVSALAVYFDTVTVGVLHTPAHTGYGRDWQRGNEQEATSSDAYQGMLDALPAWATQLRQAGKPVLIRGDWNKPLAPGHWRTRLEHALNLRLAYHKGITGDFVSSLDESQGHGLMPVLGFDHIGYGVTYNSKKK